MCGSYLYSSTLPPAVVMQTGLPSGKRDTREVLTHTTYYTLGHEHEGTQDKHVGQRTTLRTQAHGTHVRPRLEYK